jgi:lipoprotein-releasing system permease protein
MRFEIVVANRYLWSSKAQTVLLVLGVMLSVVLFIFITALIQGLRLTIISDVLGNNPHISIEVKTREPRLFLPPDTLQEPNKIVESKTSYVFVREQIRDWKALTKQIESFPGISAVSPQIVGNSFLQRGESVRTITVVGVLPDRVSAISKIKENLLQGEENVTSNRILLGNSLAKELGLRLGQPIRLRSDRSVERDFLLGGIFETGVENIDKSLGFIELTSARGLFDLVDGITRIETKVANVDHAALIAKNLPLTDFVKATPWQKQNAGIQDALNGQGRSGKIIQTFSMITIIVGITSALLLATYRRRAEIAIMRSFGLSRRFIGTIFVLQGALIGGIGASSGCLIGYYLTNFLKTLRTPSGKATFPIAPEEGGYLLVLSLTLLGSILASLYPARAASRVDPVEVLNQ